MSFKDGLLGAKWCFGKILSLDIREMVSQVYRPKMVDQVEQMIIYMDIL